MKLKNTPAFFSRPFFSALLFLLPVSVFAGSGDSLATDSLHAQTAPVKNDSIIVLDFHPIENGGGIASLDDYISVRVQNLPLLYASSGHASDDLVLYIDGVAMHGLTPLFDNRNGDSLVFHLVRDSTTAASWAVFYEAPRPKPGQKMSLSIGYEHDKPMTTRVRDFTMNFVDRTSFWIASIAIIFILVICFYLGMKTPILRDKTTDPAIKNPPYSLARTQIMFWTVVSAICFIFIWAVTHDIPEITTSTLVLIGVSVGTSAGARMIDLSQDTNKAIHQNSESEGFWKDVLSDEKGICIYRLQMVLWMLIVGFYYMDVSYCRLYMPQLDNTLLALMGISAGTYVGLKLPENKDAAPQQPNNPPVNGQ